MGVYGLKRILFVLGVFMTTLPVALAITVQESFSRFVNGFVALLSASPDIDAFVAGLLAIIPLIGLFLVVFGLIFYLSKITIFRGDDTDRYARWLAIGIALAGILMPNVYNTILSLSSTFLILGFITAIVFMAVIFVNRLRANHYSVASEMNKEQKSYLSSKSDAKKEKKEFDKIMHDIGMDKKLYAKTERDLNHLDKDLRSLSHLHGDELKAVDHLADLLRKASSAADRNDQNHVHGYVQALTRDLGGLITKLKHDGSDMKKARNLLDDIRKNITYAFKDEKEELKEEEHVQKILHHHLKNIHSLGVDDAEHIAKNIMKDASGVRHYLMQIRHAVLALRHLEEQAEQHMSEAAKYGYDAKHSVASAVRDAVMTQDLAGAHKQLDHLRSLIEHGKQQTGDISHLEQDMKRHVFNIENWENTITKLIHSIVSEEKKSLKSLHDERSENVKGAQKRIHDLESVRKTIDSMPDTLELKHMLAKDVKGGIAGNNPSEVLYDEVIRESNFLKHVKLSLDVKELKDIIEQLKEIKKKKSGLDEIDERIKSYVHNLRSLLLKDEKGTDTLIKSTDTLIGLVEKLNGEAKAGHLNDTAQILTNFKLLLTQLINKLGKITEKEYIKE